MQKKICILLLSGLLAACANSTSSDSKAETEAVSETTTTTATVTTDDSEQTNTTTKISVTSAKEKDTDVTTKSVTSASTTTKAESTTSMTTTQATTSSAKAPANTTKAAQKQQPRPASTTTTTTAKPQPQSNVVWSQSMKVWRKLCEAKTLTAAEQEMIRSEIASYASKFQGKTKIHVSYATDSFDISYIKPIHMTRNKNMLDWTVYAHLDASVDMDCKGIINYAKSEKEIYDVVAQTRNDALHLIDFGLHSNYEISKINHCLEYASEIEYNIGFDGTYLWFLTKE